MWALFQWRSTECKALHQRLEASSGDSREQLTSQCSAAGRAHLEACPACSALLDELLESRRLLAGLPALSQMDRPWFAPRVMAAIALRQRQIRSPLAIWYLVPRMAVRLTWISAICLLLAGTWAYERPAANPPAQPSVDATPDSLFETAPTPTTHDEVLVSLVERD